ncbi:MAG: cytochrome d ubiquinol oxidase subunit II, partial [Betaproteobacteria bacterium]|nr:cytochrome d ubiquinol oxidase subunit II [Betaproteobacteria bacterium]
MEPDTLPSEALPHLAGLVALLSVLAYAVLGGADFGGGTWDLFASGPRADEHRAAIGRAMGPVWEANHVWLIFLIIILFTGFPAAFGFLSIALYWPFHLVLAGIALRGAAFVFRAHGQAERGWTTGWRWVFGAASVI